jgi:hypothetical protein
MLTIMNHNNNIDQPFPSNPFEMMGPSLSTEEQHDEAAASAVLAALGASNPNKRDLDHDESDHRPSKMLSGATSQQQSYASSSFTNGLSSHPSTVTREGTPTSSDPDLAAAVLKPFPYFYYRDCSTLPDPDPLIPLTSPGRVPNFPAKMHSILSRADLADVVAWNSHGRSWRVLKPREFELKVIPVYFEHAKCSSFIRQANGWGFRRITQGRDRNSYYHEMFLRGLPHLCKMMKRPGVSEKQPTDPEQEPDLFKISEEKPVTERAQDDSILLHCTLRGGPKARMPIVLGNLSSSTNSPFAVQMPQNHMPSISAPQSAVAPAAGIAYTNTYPSQVNNNFPNMMPGAGMDNQSFNTNSYMATQQHQQQQQQQQPKQMLLQSQPEHMSLPPSAYMSSAAAPQQQAQHAPAPMTAYGGPAAPGVSQQQNQTVATPTMAPADHTTVLSPSVNPMTFMPAAFQGNSVAAAQFAAGFAAATALSNQNFREILAQALASYPTQKGNNNNSGAGNSTINGQHQQVAPVHQQQQVVPAQQYQQSMVSQPMHGQQQQQHQEGQQQPQHHQSQHQPQQHHQTSQQQQQQHHNHQQQPQQHVLHIMQQQQHQPTMMPQYVPTTAPQPQTIQ